jgi:hypothetical protein
MRTHTSVCLFLCFICVTCGGRDVSALTPTAVQLPETDSSAESSGVPPNIAVGSGLKDVVDQMARESPTFRRQLQSVAHLRRLRVRIVLEDRPGIARDRSARAHCELSRYELGSVRATIHVWSREDAMELLAHELEHAIEFTEGTNYRAMALVQPGAVWVTSTGAFETTRAINAGLEVKREMWVANAQAKRH